MSFVVLDFCLQGLMGHPYEYDRAILNAASAAGWKKRFLAAHKNVAPAIQSELNAIACFSANLDDDLVGPLGHFFAGKLGGDTWARYNIAAHGRSLARDLAGLPDEIFERDSPNLVLFPTVRHTQIPGIVDWLETVNADRQVTGCIVLHFTAFPDFTSRTCTARFYETAYRRLQRSRIKNRIRLYADSDELVREHARYTNHPIELVPIPLARDGSGEAVANREPGPVRVVFRGDARLNKGYHLLGDLFSSLRDELSGGQIVGEIQSNIRINSEGEVLRAKRSLQRLPNMVLHDEPLTSEEYVDLLRRADLVLAPYTLDYYHSQTSSVVAEAIAAGKPIIVPRGSWGWREIQRNGGGGVSFLPNDAGSLLQATRTAVSNITELSASAKRVAKTYSDFHNGDTFFRIVSSGVEP